MFPEIKQMDTPRTRSEFELRFHHLREDLKNGKLSFPVSVGESLQRLQLLPNRRLNFLSVDEPARLQANMMFQFSGFQDVSQDREEQNFHSEE